jgi:hypothetical protein
VEGRGSNPSALTNKPAFSLRPCQAGRALLSKLVAFACGRRCKIAYSLVSDIGKDAFADAPCAFR